MRKEINISFEVFNNKESLNLTARNLYEEAKKAREKSYALYSEFSVGCAILLENGEIIHGNNQENAAYPSGLCAERTAIFWTSANYPNEKIKAIFIVGAPDHSTDTKPIPPCGACRQVLLEYENKQHADIELYFAAPNSEIFHLKNVKDLLPFSFDSSYFTKG